MFHTVGTKTDGSSLRLWHRENKSQQTPLNLDPKGWKKLPTDNRVKIADALHLNPEIWAALQDADVIRAADTDRIKVRVFLNSLLFILVTSWITPVF